MLQATNFSKNYYLVIRHIFLFFIIISFFVVFLGDWHVLMGNSYQRPAVSR